MRKLLTTLLAIALLVSLCACGNDTNTEPTVSPSASPKASKSPEETGLTEIGTSVFYYEGYQPESDSGDFITPREGADLVLYDVIASGDFLQYITDDNCIYITFDDIITLDGTSGNEAYIYSVASGSVSGGYKGDDYEVLCLVAVDYMEDTAFIYDDFVGGDIDSVDADFPNWWGLYMGDGFSVDISNFNGTSFNFAFSNLRNGEYFFEGVAAIDPEDSNMAMYMDIGFYISEDSNTIDFLASEDSEWEHLRGQYTRLE